MQTSPRRAKRTNAPAGSTPSWFTDKAWFLETEAKLLADRLIPRPFDLDPCGHLEAPVSQLILARGGVVHTEADDGLTRSWARRCAWINPPYESSQMDAWGRAIQRWRSRADGLVALIPAWTDRAWWHDHIEPERMSGAGVVIFVRGRLRFGWPGNPVGEDGDSAMFPSALVAWRLR